ncbi:MAG: hypothetical protein LAO18_10670 [Acidobacteriia bacterium]|nr:hypothetical protein [Terriglobia bacterium]
MSKGKYKRQRENAQEKQGQPSIPLGDEKGSSQLNTASFDNPASNRGNQKKPSSWYGRAWEWIKKDYVTSISVAVFTGVLAAVSIFQGCMMRRQLAEMQRAQLPFVFTSANLGNNWLSESEHDLQVTISVRNVSAYPATNAIASKTKIWMGATPNADEVIKHCEIEYPPNPIKLTFAPMSPGVINFDALNTVHTDYINDKTRIQNGIDSVVIYGGIKYSGVNGGEFETPYCYVFLPKGDFRFGTCQCGSIK